MAISHSCFSKLLIVSLQVSFLIAACSGNFYRDINVTWGDRHTEILDNGNLLTVKLDEDSGCGFQSKNQYMFAKNIEMQIKLVPGNSAGTVTAYYLKSEGSANWDEIDFEFLGNVTGQPYVLHTNVFTQGKGNREQQFYLWFDPTADFHTYSILWSPQHIVLSVDGIPIREFKKLERLPYLDRQPMRLYSSLWNADDWATRGGLVKIDWSQGPFQASYRNFNDKACCIWSQGSSSCRPNFLPTKVASWYYNLLDAASKAQIRWVRDNFMIYDYCKDFKRFPQGLPKECTDKNNQY